MPWKQIRNDVFCLCLGYAACFFFESDKIPEPFAFTIFGLPILFGVSLRRRPPCLT